ncbi:thylakoid lumenal 16.5 kDa protein, chloroplastic [Impatiens glandulifera]|uniref:thylakoid lumenal 16.5 kDa protein, chloroplastic n=1 Tax=Impatiens glandulifera TaxID=253017 RepID=UPI001FB0ED73|nr:thylakoid lumenal 16.5 kDa protein, chloroplastic [Impatiens glandulifera]
MMATAFLSSSAKTIFPSSSSQKSNGRPQFTVLCKSSFSEPKTQSLNLSKRGLTISLAASFILSLSNGANSIANAAILEADDDLELLEKVKNDRKKRLERQGFISSYDKERAYLQEVVYKFSKVGQALEKNDLSAVSSVLGKNTDTEWLKKTTAAFNKLSSSPEEKTEVDTFNSSLSNLISSVGKNDVESSKIAFYTSASAFEKWTELVGLTGELKGL